MTHQPPPPALKRHQATGQPSAADETNTPTRQTAEVAARQGVLSALRTDPRLTPTATPADRRNAA
ncbi:hypothetical protein [Streptomyces wuyuanensis]|uniref:Uncharacterized protein n=1 Tax=Streptomyces wuyuanensis TaxID=1196353 RepID=A0A1G9V1D2_9ACTN|nr:hypothetical protein [Streptomyces wuyuanensis]SDM66101.1 hypothetical protein SAMN05444921_111174 [Streptomyces wuyuanensis]